MIVEKQQLRDYLEQLNAAVEDSSALAADKSKLSELVSNIEQQLDEPVWQTEPQSLTEQVDELISSIETEHPSVASILNNIMVTLSSMGV
jgi:hypothetical protein